MSSDDVARRRPVVAFVVADAVALMVFVVAGIRSHHEVGALDLFLRNAVPLEVAWFAVSAVAATYRRPGLRTLLWTWIVAVPAGLVVRSIWVGSPSGTRSARVRGDRAGCSRCCSCSPVVGSWR